MNVTIRQTIDATALIRSLDKKIAQAKRLDQQLTKHTQIRQQPTHKQNDFANVVLLTDLDAATQSTPDASGNCTITTTNATAHLVEFAPDGQTATLAQSEGNPIELQVYNTSTTSFPARPAKEDPADPDPCQTVYQAHRDWRSKRWELIGGSGGEGENSADVTCESLHAIFADGTIGEDTKLLAFDGEECILVDSPTTDVQTEIDCIMEVLCMINAELRRLIEGRESDPLCPP